jgi:hypothetical protein
MTHSNKTRTVKLTTDTTHPHTMRRFGAVIRTVYTDDVGEYVVIDNERQYLDEEEEEEDETEAS